MNSSSIVKAPFQVTLLESESSGFRWCGDIDEVTPVESRFLAAIDVGGVPLHLEGVQVKRDDKQGQCAAYPSWEEWLCELFTLGHPDEPYATLHIEGREYVVAAYPFTA